MFRSNLSMTAALATLLLFLLSVVTTVANPVPVSTSTLSVAHPTPSCEIQVAEWAWDSPSPLDPPEIDVSAMDIRKLVDYHSAPCSEIMVDNSGQMTYRHDDTFSEKVTGVVGNLFVHYSPSGELMIEDAAKVNLADANGWLVNAEINDDQTDIKDPIIIRVGHPNGHLLYPRGPKPGNSTSAISNIVRHNRMVRRQVSVAAKVISGALAGAEAGFAGMFGNWMARHFTGNDMTHPQKPAEQLRQERKVKEGLEKIDRDRKRAEDMVKETEKEKKKAAKKLEKDRKDEFKKAEKERKNKEHEKQKNEGREKKQQTQERKEETDVKAKESQILEKARKARLEEQSD